MRTQGIRLCTAMRVERNGGSDGARASVDNPFIYCGDYRGGGCAGGAAECVDTVDDVLTLLDIRFR